MPPFSGRVIGSIGRIFDKRYQWGELRVWWMCADSVGDEGLDRVGIEWPERCQRSTEHELSVESIGVVQRANGVIAVSRPNPNEGQTQFDFAFREESQFRTFFVSKGHCRRTALDSRHGPFPSKVTQALRLVQGRGDLRHVPR